MAVETLTKEEIMTLLATKQDRLAGIEKQIVTFNANGEVTYLFNPGNFAKQAYLDTQISELKDDIAYITVLLDEVNGEVV